MQIEVNQKLITRDTYLNIEKIVLFLNGLDDGTDKIIAMKLLKINKVVDESVKLLSEKNNQDLEII